MLCVDCDSRTLGGLRAGTIELRADGSLRDWNIFNNHPHNRTPFGGKVQLEEALFGLRVEGEGLSSRAWALRTHAPGDLPCIEQIEYSGSFPVSRLRFSDQQLPIDVDLYAYSEFHIGNARASATPAAIFSFQLRNPTDKTIQAGPRPCRWPVAKAQVAGPPPAWPKSGSRLPTLASSDGWSPFAPRK